ncbi:carboxylesterase family protein [Sarocladium implicatum]|nr:carboxylesterase family protein [Sarocladium implicatum]
MKAGVLSLLGLAATALAAPSPVLEDRGTQVSVKLSSTGDNIVGSSLLNVDSFRGIPFADSPTGSLRLRPPQRLSRKLGTFDATPIAPACPQMLISRDSFGIIGGVANDLLNLPLLANVSGREDCLSVTVQRPAGTKKGDKLPVLFWIFGGGFELGATSMYDATSLLAEASKQNQDFVYVAVNYRVAGFGFMNGKEILEDGASNLGLLDQRMGLEWVADNIADFGGDPDKVTIWGESAGAISVWDQMALYGGDANYKGKSLFRGAIMNSGSLVPADPVDCPKGQAIYDEVVRRAGCSGSSDTLNCLREVDYKTFLDAVNSVPGILGYTSVALSYLPRPDGVVLPESPNKLAEEGRYHAVPMIIGDQEDEGTIFALFQPNLTTVDKVVDYFSTYFFNSASKAQLTRLVQTYQPYISGGSPFRTLLLNEWYPGFKRLAALLGDLTFTLTRRLFLEITAKVNPDVPSWSYLSSYNYGTPIVGTFHASDLLQTFFGILPNNAARSTRTYYFNFLHNLDPNVGVDKYDAWPEWKEKKDLMWFEKPTSNSILRDDFRQDSYDVIADLESVLYI